MDGRRAFGDAAESLAARFLLEAGCTILARQYHTRYGEVDIVADHPDGLRFVEVKARKSQQFGRPEEAVTRLKLRKIAAVAEHFLTKHALQHRPWQIDVIAISYTAAEPELRYYPNVGGD